MNKEREALNNLLNHINKQISKESENLLKIKHFKEQFDLAKECFCNGFAIARFIYNPKDKTIYDYIDIHDYRSCTHSDIIEHFGFIKVEVHRLEFNQEKCFDGSYLYNEFGIPGLKYSSICSQKMIDLLPKPSKQDLDNIEQYIECLKLELQEVNSENYSNN